MASLVHNVTRGADLSLLGSSTFHALTCRHSPSRRGRACRLLVMDSSTPWRISKAPGDDESDDLTLQASMCSRVSIPSGEWLKGLS